jgi:hypothetical protein
MSPPNEEEYQDLANKDLTFLLAIAGRLDALSKLAASDLDKDRTIYYLYSFFDAFSCAYSMYKYFIDMLISSNDPDLMHEYLMSPCGITIALAESIFMVSYCLLACHFETAEKDTIKQRFSASWIYFRDAMKALKNAYKGWRSAVLILNAISSSDLRCVVTPIGLVMGLIAATIRLYARYVKEKRKNMMDENKRLLKEIKNLPTLSSEEREVYLKTLEEYQQAIYERNLGYCAVAAGGFIDGLYLYVGVMGLAFLPTPFLIPLALLSGAYTLSCIIYRVYEEWDYQVMLLAAKTKCELMLLAKEIETNYAQLQNDTDTPSIQTLQKIQKLKELIKQFEIKRQVLHAQTNRTYLSATLLGLKNGLYAYGMLTSALFILATVLLLLYVPFPPALLIVTVLSGLGFITAFIAQALIANYWQRNTNQLTDEEQLYQDLLSMDKDNNILPPDMFKQALNRGLFFDPAQPYFFQEWTEVFRSLFSGLGKGQKLTDFTFNFLQEIDVQGHYHDTPIMLIIAVVYALVVGIVLGLRALAKGLGRAALAQEVSLATKPAQTPKDGVSVKKQQVTTDTPRKKISVTSCSIFKLSKSANDYLNESGSLPSFGRIR